MLAGGGPVGCGLLQPCLWAVGRSPPRGTATDLRPFASPVGGEEEAVSRLSARILPFCFLFLTRRRPTWNFSRTSATEPPNLNFPRPTGVVARALCPLRTGSVRARVVIPIPKPPELRPTRLMSRRSFGRPKHQFQLFDSTCLPT